MGLKQTVKNKRNENKSSKEKKIREREKKIEKKM